MRRQSKGTPLLSLRESNSLSGRIFRGFEAASKIRLHMVRVTAGRNIYFILFFILSLIWFRGPLSALVAFSFQYEHYSHIVLMPLVSVGLIYLERRKIFSNIRYGFGVGTVLLILGMIVYWLGKKLALVLNENDYLSLTILSIVILWIGGFILCYGLQASRAALFPLLFLLFMVPIPSFLLERAIFFLQKGSAEVVHYLFKMAGVPVFREGLVFSLPGLTIEVAKECSGIRSSLALFIVMLLAGHLLLRSSWKKAVLIPAIFPVLLLKNGLRIATLSLLAIHVDRAYLTGSLHRHGGIVFFLLALAILAPLLRLLQKSERSNQKQKSQRQIGVPEHVPSN